MTLKTLVLDIETSPTLATVWGLWGQNIPISSIIGNSEVLTWAASWVGEEEVIYSSLGFATKKAMLKELYDLLEEADAVVTYNGDRFDLPIVNQEFLLQGWGPPAPYKSVDIIKTMKKRFRGTSNKLDYWLKRLGLGQKVEHRGHQLWLDCMNGDKKAFEEMSEYNVGDVIKTEQLFHRIKPWIINLPSMSVFTNSFVCPSCGSAHLQKRGTYQSKSATYQRYRCNGCGDWSRDAKAITVEKYNKVMTLN